MLSWEAACTMFTYHLDQNSQEAAFKINLVERMAKKNLCKLFDVSFSNTYYKAFSN